VSIVEKMDNMFNGATSFSWTLCGHWFTSTALNSGRMFWKSCGSLCSSTSDDSKNNCPNGYASSCDTAAGSYDCTCNEGFTGDGTTCTALTWVPGPFVFPNDPDERVVCRLRKSEEECVTEDNRCSWNRMLSLCNERGYQPLIQSCSACAIGS